MGGHETATCNSSRHLHSEAWRDVERLRRKRPSNGANRDGARDIRGQRSGRKIFYAARSAERRIVPTRGRTKARQDHARGLRKSQSSPRPNARPDTEAPRVGSHTTGRIVPSKPSATRQLPIASPCPEPKARHPASNRLSQEN